MKAIILIFVILVSSCSSFDDEFDLKKLDIDVKKIVYSRNYIESITYKLNRRTITVSDNFEIINIPYGNSKYYIENRLHIFEISDLDTYENILAR